MVEALILAVGLGIVIFLLILKMNEQQNEIRELKKRVTRLEQPPIESGGWPKTYGGVVRRRDWLPLLVVSFMHSTRRGPR